MMISKIRKNEESQVEVMCKNFRNQNACLFHPSTNFYKGERRFEIGWGIHDDVGFSAL